MHLSSPLRSHPIISNILTTVYSFILSNPLGHQSPYLVYICHLAAHRCGWLSFGIICRSIKSLDKGFDFFGSVIFTLVSILDVAILSPPLQQNTCYPILIFILSSPDPFFNQFIQFSDSESFAITLLLFTILKRLHHPRIVHFSQFSNFHSLSKLPNFLLILLICHMSINVNRCTVLLISHDTLHHLQLHICLKASVAEYVIYGMEI